eukprot:INCI6195.4.p1 GENE.INCI6195.4~~INCI6195.4.p1  ORF type:complete len:208 (-),score=39.47 INCI6195.4:1472-2095(-)
MRSLAVSFRVALVGAAALSLCIYSFQSKSLQESSSGEQQAPTAVETAAPHDTGRNHVAAFDPNMMPAMDASAPARKKKTPPGYPAHWGQPPAVQTKDVVQLPSPYGRGSSTLKTWIENNQRKDAQQVPNGGSSSAAVASVDDANKVIEFPAHWGEPPLRQTRDMRRFPPPFENRSGSGTILKWIQQNQARDAAAARQSPSSTAAASE